MTVATGSRLGSLRDLAPLGACGMGEVSRARGRPLDPMRKHLGIAILFAAVVFATPSRGHAQETTLDDFEGARAPEPWTFSNGPEFPGAKGSLTKDAPQNSMPPAGEPSWPTRLTAATKTPLAMAWLRIIVCQAACWLAPYCCFSSGSQPIAVG